MAEQRRVYDEGVAAEPTQTCVRQLMDMGYGGMEEDGSPGTRHKLNMIAEMCGGDTAEAVDILEEDRQAQEALNRARFGSRR